MSNAVSSTGILVKRGGAGTIVSSSVANPSVITTLQPHGLISAQDVTIAGHTGATPSINGAQVATVTGANTFTIPVNVTVGGTGGTAIIDDADLVTVGEITNVDPGGMSRNKIETSTHNDGSESHVLGILRQDDPTFTINYVGADASHVAVLADIAGNLKRKWQFVFPSGVKRTGMAYVQRFRFLGAAVDGVQGAELAITWAGPVTEEAA